MSSERVDGRTLRFQHRLDRLLDPLSDFVGGAGECEAAGVAVGGFVVDELLAARIAASQSTAWVTSG
jgi:hypothetical protein